MQSRTELLTTQFYEWELRGRGWQVWNHPVNLEPPFAPFLGHRLEPESVVFDDARRPTFFSRLVDRAYHLLGGALRTDEESPSRPTVEEPPAPFVDDSELIELEVLVPSTLRIAAEAAERCLVGLVQTEFPIAFEVLGRHRSVTIGFACRRADEALLRQQFAAHFPDATVHARIEPLRSVWAMKDEAAPVIVDFGLAQEFMRPVRGFDSLELDPLVSVAGALGGLGDDDVALLQCLFQPTRSAWAESIARAVTNEKGDAFFENSPDMVALARRKINRPLFAVGLRIAARSLVLNRAWDIVRGVGAALAQFADPLSNEFIPLKNDGYDPAEHEQDLLARRSRRSGMILNSEELRSLIHPPSASVRTERLVRTRGKTKAAPLAPPRPSLILGENEHGGERRIVALTIEQRLRHMHLVGASGTGKSTLLLHAILQDIQNGQGVGVLDPHGDLIDQILERIPDHRLDDVILFDASEEERPIGFNILSAHAAWEKNLLSSDLVSVFRRLSTSWGDQMTAVLGNAILSFLESTDGGTLADLRRFLVEADFRRSFLQRVQDPELVYFWQKEFPLLAGRPQAPLLTRLNAFLRAKSLRRIVSQRDHGLDLAAVMDQGKVLLGKLSHGAIGEENAYLLGTLLVSKFQQVALGRQAVSEADRKPFFLYIDEFHHFITPSMAPLLTGARKYRLGLVLAHQGLRQLSQADEAVASAVLGNAGTRICFRVGEEDARKLADGFSSFDVSDLQNLGVGEAIGRIDQPQYDFNLRTHPLPPLDAPLAAERRERVSALSRQRHGASPTEQASIVSPSGVAASSPAPRNHPGPIPEQDPTSLKPPIEPTKRIDPPRPVKTTVVPALGRGGPQHKYLQELIRRWADDHGYRAVIELPVAEGTGSVDVALERDGRRLACEISVTSTPTQELANIRKCLDSSFQQVLVVSPDLRHLSKLRKRIEESLDAVDHARVHCLTPESLFEFLMRSDNGETKENMTRGYRVKVQYRPDVGFEPAARRQAVAGVVLKAMRRLKEDGGDGHDPKG